MLAGCYVDANMVYFGYKRQHLLFKQVNQGSRMWRNGFQWDAAQTQDGAC